MCGGPHSESVDIPDRVNQNESNYKKKDCIRQIPFNMFQYKPDIPWVEVAENQSENGK